MKHAPAPILLTLVSGGAFALSWLLKPKSWLMKSRINPGFPSSDRGGMVPDSNVAPPPACGGVAVARERAAAESLTTAVALPLCSRDTVPAGNDLHGPSGPSAKPAGAAHWPAGPAPETALENRGQADPPLAGGPAAPVSGPAAPSHGGMAQHAPCQTAPARTRMDPAAAAAWPVPPAGENGGGAIPHGIISEWSGRDGAATVQWLDTLSGDQSRAYGPAFAGWAKSDPLGAIQRIGAMKPSANRDNAIGGFIFSYRWEDLVTSIAWANQIQDPGFRKFVLTLTAEAYARKEPAAAAAWLRGSGLPAETRHRFLMAMGEIFRNSTDPVLRQEAFLELLSGMTKENAPVVRGQLGTLDPTDPAFRDFYFTWGKLAGLEAVMSGIVTGAPSMGPSLAGWASADPVAASGWLRNLDLRDSAAGHFTLGHGLKEENLRDSLARELVSSLAATDPSGALAVAASLAADGHGVPGLVQSIAHQVSKIQGVDAAARWAAAFSDAAGPVPCQRPDGQTERETACGADLRPASQEVVQAEPQGSVNWTLTPALPAENSGVSQDIPVPCGDQPPSPATGWWSSWAAAVGVTKA